MDFAHTRFALVLLSSPALLAANLESESLSVMSEFRRGTCGQIEEKKRQFSRRPINHQ
jgi:hypothetical protein